MSATHIQKTLTALSLALNFAACGSDVACLEPTASHSEAIKVAEGSLLPTESIEPVVLALLTEMTQEMRVICTATRTASGVALTAKHCVRDLDPTRLWLRGATDQAIAHGVAASESDCSSELAPTFEQLQVRGVSRHDTLDLALLLFDEDASVTSATIVDALPEAVPQLRIAGFGTTEAQERGGLRAIAVDLLATSSDVLSVQARGGGACTGDSGGPLYADEEGRILLFGVLSRGSASCYGADEYVNITALGTWLDAAVGAER